MIINTVKEYLLEHHGVKNSNQLGEETGLVKSTCRYFFNNPERYLSDNVLDVLCKRYGCQVGDLMRYLPNDEVQNYVKDMNRRVKEMSRKSREVQFKTLRIGDYFKFPSNCNQQLQGKLDTKYLKGVSCQKISTRLFQPVQLTDKIDNYYQGNYELSPSSKVIKIEEEI